MKKTAKILTLLSLIVALILTLTACSTYGKIQKALGDIGYAVIENNTTANEIDEQSDVPVTIHVLSNADSLSVLEALKTNIVIIFEFKSTDKMKEFYDDSDALKGLISDIEKDGTAEEFYNSLVEKGFANGNCLVISLNAFASEDVMTAVKNA